MAEQNILEVGNASIHLVGTTDPFRDGHTTGYLEFYDERHRPSFPLTSQVVYDHLMAVWQEKTAPSLWKAGRITGWIEALLENSQGLLKPGFFVKARIPSRKVDQVLTVPQDALQYSYGVYKLCLIQNDVLKETEVKIGELSGDEAEIVSGAKVGDMIAVPVKGQVLKDGGKIQILP